MSSGAAGLPACAALVRRRDLDRYLALLFAPADRRDGLFALYAFATELARVPERVTEPMLGAIRLQWWREALEGIAAGTPRRHEVVLPLAEAIVRHDIALATLHRVVDAWDEELAREAPPTLADIEKLAVATDGAILEAGFVLLGVRPDAGTAIVARHGALAVALTRLLREAGARASGGRPALPRDVLARHGLDLGTILDGDRDRRLASAAEDMATEARRHIAETRRLGSALPRRARCLLLPVAFAARDLDHLRRCRFDLFEPALACHGLGRLLPVVWRGLLGRV